MKKLFGKNSSMLNSLSIKKKLFVIYIFCVLVPLLITDSVILTVVRDSEDKRVEHEMDNVSNAAHHAILNEIDAASALMKKIYTNTYINSFLNRQFTSDLDYYEQYNDYFNMRILNMNGVKVSFFVDNDTIINGSEIQKVEKAKSYSWYQYAEETGISKGLYIGYAPIGGTVTNNKRAVYMYTKMDFFDKFSNNYLLIEFDYTRLTNELIRLNSDMDVYICDEHRVVLSNGKDSSVNKSYSSLEEVEKIEYCKDVVIQEMEYQIRVEPEKKNWTYFIVEHVPYAILLLLFNIFLPVYMFGLINKSFAIRIQELSDAFDGVDDEKLVPINNPRGDDEIGRLMINYNRMVDRTNNLIEEVFKNTIREQEMMVARQKAELLALHSQINPHFLFNALESIRMHSLLKRESETADMVEKLAKIQRQYVEWQSDTVSVKTEMELVKAYLGLQKYRFGDRLSYRIEVEDGCELYLVPKLSIVTFVENACVHGIESKTTPGWIFVRITEEDEDLVLEIEDTGSGMDSDIAMKLLSKMQNASIDMLKEKGRVGIVNACLRLKMISEESVRFELESEDGIGTLITIRIPLLYVKGNQ